MNLGLPISFSLMAAMLWPALFYAGAAAMAVPLLIHLFSRRRFQRTRWAAMDWLREAHRENRRRMRLQEIILLVLRCLAILLIGLLLARWFIRPDTLLAIVGRQAQTERIILLDDSFSMRLRDHEDTVFGRGVVAVQRIVDTLRNEAPDDPLIVLVTSRPDRPVFSEATVGRLDVKIFNEQLNTLNCSNRSSNLPATCTAVRQLLKSRQAGTRATVYLISDFQKIDWVNAADSTSATPVAALADWIDENRRLRIVLVDVGTDADNVCVRAIEPEQRQAVTSVAGRYLVEVANYGRNEARSLNLQLYVGQAAQPPAPLPPIAPGETVTLAVEAIFTQEGSQSLIAELEPDALSIDNTRGLAVPVTHALRVLLVNGEPATDPLDDETYLLAIALRPEGAEFSGNEVTVVDENEFEDTDLTNFHVVVLANVYRITEETAARLENYAAGGGGVLFFLGDQIDADLYNRMLYRDGKGLLPTALTETISAPADRPGFPVGDPDITHPILRRFPQTEVSYFDSTRVWRFLDVRHEQSSQPAPIAGQPLEPRDSRGTASVLLRFVDTDRRPAIIERTFGQGRCILITTTADKEWNNLADQPIYVVLVQEMIQYLARSGGRGGEQLVGQPIRLILDPATQRPTVTLKTPGFPNEPAVTINAHPDSRSGHPVIEWTDTEQPGLYRFEIAGITEPQQDECFAVNVDARESDTRRVDRRDLEAAVGDVPMDYLRGEELGRPNGGPAETRRELWPALLVALLIVLLTEQALAWRFGSGGSWKDLIKGNGA